MCYAQWFINIVCLFFALICTEAVLPNKLLNFSSSISTLIAISGNYGDFICLVFTIPEAYGFRNEIKSNEKSNIFLKLLN